ncbi:hypothetical protein BC940DRAFT_305785 [Gongronella butleri]|nr:hypothetical protein BC940DRAFT_305785 [Gongronella butleri]
MSQRKTNNIWHAVRICHTLWLDSQQARARAPALTMRRTKALQAHPRSFHLSSARCYASQSACSASPAATAATTTTSKASDSTQLVSAAIQQSDTATAHSLVDLALQLLRHHKPVLAWECYTDLSSRQLLRHVSTDHFRQLIKLFSASKQPQSLDYVLTLVEDMKHLGYPLAHREKLIVMQMLGKSGMLQEMEKVFDDIGIPLSKHPLTGTSLAPSPSSSSSSSSLSSSLSPSSPLSSTSASSESATDNDVHQPFHIMLASYQEHANSVGHTTMLARSLAIYGDILDMGIVPSATATRLLMENIRLVGVSADHVEQVWEWAWHKMGQHVGGVTRDLTPDLYRDLVLYFAAAGRPEYGLAVNDIMVRKQMPRDRRMLVSLMHKVGRAGDLPRAMQLLDELKALAMPMDTLVYNVLLDIHAHKTPQPDIASLKQIYTQMQKDGAEPDVTTYGTLMHLAAQQGSVALVSQWYEEMLLRGIKANDHIHAAVTEAFLAYDDREGAMAVLRSLAPTSPIALYNLMLTSLVRRRDLDHAHQLLQFMENDNVLRKQMDARSFSPLLSHYANGANVSAVHSLLERMKQLNVTPTEHTHTAILEAYARAGDMARAEEMLPFVRNAHAYNALLDGYVRRHDADKVFATYKLMLKSGIKMSEHTYGILMSFYARRQEYDAVDTLMRNMQASHIAPSLICWTTLLQSHVAHGRYSHAKQVLEAMVDAKQQPSWTTWSILIHGMTRQGELSLVHRLLPDMIEQQRSILLRPGRDLDASFKNADKRHDCKEYSPLASSFSGEDYETKVPLLVRDLADQVKRKQTAADHTRRAQKEQKQPLDDDHHVSSPPYATAYTAATPPPHLFVSLIRQLTKQGMYRKARNVVQLMRQYDTPLSIPVYTALLSLYSREGRFDDVDTLFHAMKNPAGADKTTITLFGLDPLPVPVQKQPSPSSPSSPPALSPFALSIYMDSLMNQNRLDEVASLWDSLSAQAFPFDAVNWNRYIVYLLLCQRDQEAYRVAHDYLADSNDDDHHHHHDDTAIHTHRRAHDVNVRAPALHRRTCFLLAKSMRIPGYTNFGQGRLRDAVTEHLHLHHHNPSVYATIAKSEHDTTTS